MLALGRSGTNFLASLLTQARGARIEHEPHPDDPLLLQLRYAGRFDRVVDDMLERRFRELLGDGSEVPEVYGEVNSYLRYEPDWLRRRFDPVMVHLVRDGRAFVRSVWIREVFTPGQPVGRIVPADDDPAAARWDDMDRFARICWYWAHTNAFLADRIETRLRFEDVLKDYGALAETILRPAGLDVPEAVWRREVDRPRNTSREYRVRDRVKRLVRRHTPPPAPLPRWEEWSEDRKRTFREICGPTMERLGYRCP